jgi:phosphatidylserine/phosphatidylglycerophosphate/cardiolipin synthase-like enzyme
VELFREGFEPRRIDGVPMGNPRGLVFATLVAVMLSPLCNIAPESLSVEARNVGGRDTACTGVCISEVMPNADGSDQGMYPSGEWVELFNSGTSDENLDGWAIVDLGGWYHPINSETWVGFDELENPFVLKSGEYAVIAENEVGTLRLNNGGETVYLKNQDNSTIHEVITGEASNGVSKVGDPSTPGGTWVDSQMPSPGAENPGEQGVEDPVDVDPSWWNGEFDVKFTRIMPGEVPDRSNDWLEITNLGSEQVSLDGWNITRVRASGPWHSTIISLTIDAGSSVVLTDNPFNLLQDGGIVAQDGNVALNNMPWLVNSGSSLMLVEPNGTVVDSIVYGGGIAEIDGWNGPAISVPGDGSPGLILMRGSGCGDYPDTDTGSDWEERWIRIGASTFCDGGQFSGEDSSSISPSIGPDSAFNDLYHWIGLADETIHLHIYQFMSPDLSHSLIDAMERGVEVTILLEEGILDGSSTIDNQRGHAQTLHDAGATVFWMEDPSQISSPYAYIHSKVAVRDSESVWISSGNWKDSSLPSDGVGNREWSVILNSEEAAELVLSRLSWDENPNHLHISVHSSSHSPSNGWSMEEVSFEGGVTAPDTIEGAFDAQLMTCPDDCVEGVISMIDSAEYSIDLSVQYLDLDWYWGFGDNPIIGSLYDAVNRGVKLRIMLNGFYAEWDEEIRDTIHMFNTNWNATEGLDATARLMASSNEIVKLHNKGAIIDGESVLVGSMNWGSSATLRNREMGVLIHQQEVAEVYLSSFNEDWSRLDSSTDSDGDLMPDSWELQYGLNRHSAAILGTALSEQSLDLDEDGLDNLREFQLGGDPLDPDTDGDCIPDGEEEAFAQSVLRSPTLSMTSGDVDENGIPDGEQWGCEDPEEIDPQEGNETNETDPEEEETDDEEGFINIREDAMTRPGANLLFGLMTISAISLLIAGITTFRKPRSSTDEVLVDDSGYRFDDAGSELAILKGTSFDEESEDVRALTKGKDDGSHGKIVLDGFGFDREKTTRDEVQWRLDSGQSMDRIREELGEEE